MIARRVRAPQGPRPLNVNPMTHLVVSVRGLFLGGPVGSHVWWTLAWCAGFVVVFMPLALHA
jgi:oleandomycin transport system permease protein